MPPKYKKSDITPIDDLLLPRSLVARAAKSVLPEKGAVQKEAMTAIQEAATVFVSYIASTANDHARQSGRKAINAKDLLESLQLLEYEGFIPRLEAELEKVETVTSNNAKPKKHKAADNSNQPKEASLSGDNSGPTPKRPRGHDAQPMVIDTMKDANLKETSDSDDTDDAGGEIGDDDVEVSGEENIERHGEIDVADDLGNGSEHARTEDEAIDTSDSD